MAQPFPAASSSYKLCCNVDKSQGELKPGLLQGHITWDEMCQDEEVNPNQK